MNTGCSVALLESALAGNLPPEDEAALLQHLEECEGCSTALEQMAGGPAWCQEAVSLLVRQKLDAGVPSRDQWSEVDFTVEHLEPTDEPNVLGRLGGYDVLDIIGRGGMGVVLKGFDRELKRSVAIKVLAPHLAQNSLARKRFAREAQAAAAVVHPHVVAIHQVQPGGRLPFLVMPLVAGASLAERLKAQGTLELKEILRIGMQAAAGLAAAHEQGLVHRDVKPANILLEKGVERAVLTDFGLACAADDVTLTRWGIIAGTPPYMSPEQARGEPLDGRSDLFSLGCVLYEMATGVSPFLADSVVATIRRLVDDPPQAMASLNPELPPWFITLVERLLEKDPSRRFNSAKEVSELLEGCLAHVQQPASAPLPAGLPKPVSNRGRRFNLGIKGVLTMIGTLGVGLLGVLLTTANPPDISGPWAGEDWGTVVLTKVSDTEYTGTYIDTVGKQSIASVAASGSSGSSGSYYLRDNMMVPGPGPGSGSLGSSSSTAGEIRLKWSRIERRFNGTWREGEDRFGELSLRLVGDEIRGALTTDAKSKINPATPRLADLAWRRAVLSMHATTRFEFYPIPIMDGMVHKTAPLSQAANGADRFLSVVGTMQPPAQVSHVWAENTGVVTELTVSPGQRVETGQPIVQLNCPLLQDQVQTNQALVDELNGRLAKLKASPPPINTEARFIAKAEFEKEQDLVEIARDAESRLAVVNKSSPGAVPQQDIDNARATRLTAEVEEKKARARYDALAEQPRLHQEKLEATEAQLRIAKAQLAESRELLELCTVRAPADGIVFSLHAAVGQKVLARSMPGAREICQIADVHDIEIRAEVPPDVAPQIDLAQDIEVEDLVGGTPLGTDHVIGNMPRSNPAPQQAGRIAMPAGAVLPLDLRSTPASQQAGRIAMPAGAVLPLDLRSTPASQQAGRIVQPDPMHVGNPVIVHIMNPNWKLYRPGGQVTLRFKLLAAQSTSNQSGAIGRAELNAANARVRLAAAGVQERKANLQVAAAVVLRAEANLLNCERQEKLAEKEYQQARVLRAQKVYNEEALEAVRIKWEAAKADIEVARAELKAAQTKSAVAANELNQAEVELQAARAEAVRRGVLPIDAGGLVPPPVSARSLDAPARPGDPVPPGELLNTVVQNPGAPMAVVPAPRDLTGFRQNVGQTYLFLVPALENHSLRVDHGRVFAEYPGQVWGSDIYSDDSTLATAAVHAGLLLPGMQVVLRVTILPGQASYQGSTRHGVTSASWGAWGGSYRIEKPTAEDIRRINAADQPKPMPGTVGQQPAKDGDAAVGGAITPPPVSAPSSKKPPPDKHALAIAEAELDKARAAVELARSNAKRMAELAKERVVDEGLVDEADARVRMAEADVKAAQARLDALLGPESETLALVIARAELEKAQADTQLARLMVARLKRLSEVNAITDETVIKAEVDVRKAEAEEKVAKARLDSLLERSSRDEEKAKYWELDPASAAPAGTGGGSSATSSPVRHTVSQQPTKRDVAPYEEFTGRLVTIREVRFGEKGEEVEPSPSIGVRFDMDERPYRRYQELIRAGKVKGVGGSVTAGLSDEKSLPRLGKLERFEDEFNPNTGAIGVYGILPNPDGLLLPGMSVSVRLNFGPPHSALEVPQQAVHHEHGMEHAYVWVVNDQSIVQRRFVRTGATDDNGRMWIIEEGLSPNDIVVVEGTEGLKPGENIGPPPAEQQGSLLLDPKYLVRVYAPFAGEIVRIGSPPNSEKGPPPDSEPRPFRYGDRVRKGDLLAVVRSKDNDVEKHSAKSDVRAPIDGTIVEKNCHVGEIVDPSFDLFKIASDNTPLPRDIDGTGGRVGTQKSGKDDGQQKHGPHPTGQQPAQREVLPIGEFTGRLVTMDQLLSARAPEKSIAVQFYMDDRSYKRYEDALRAGKVKTFGDSFAAGLSDEQGFPRTGTLAYVADEIHTNSGAMMVYGYLPNPDGLLLPDMTVRVRMILGPPCTVIEVPQEAVHHDQDQTYVWVLNDHKVAERRLVRTGGIDEDGRMRIVEYGLSPQDTVVVEATKGLTSDDKIGPSPAQPLPRN